MLQHQRAGTGLRQHVVVGGVVLDTSVDNQTATLNIPRLVRLQLDTAGDGRPNGSGRGIDDTAGADMGRLVIALQPEGLRIAAERQLVDVNLVVGEVGIRR